MAISAINVGTTANDGTGDTLRDAFAKANGNFTALEGASLTERVAGGAGFVNVSGAITLDLSAARSLHHTLTGNATGPSFTNVPSTSEFSASALWVLKVDATGGYTLTSTPTVTWLDGSSWADLDLSANATNIVALQWVGATVYASLLWNGALSLDPFVLSFADNGAQGVPITRATTLPLGDVTNLELDGTAGTGTLTFKKNSGSDITGNQAFVAGDVLTVTLASSTTPSVVSIPRVV